jgi:hypothetical protein
MAVAIIDETNAREHDNDGRIGLVIARSERDEAIQILAQAPGLLR